MRNRMRNTLSRLLLRRGWSDGELARRTGLSRSHINRLKNAHVRPTVRDALLISAALEVPPETAFYLED